MSALILLFKSMVAGYHRRDGVYVPPHHRKGGAAAKPGAGQLSLFTAAAGPAKPNPFKGLDPLKSTPDMFAGKPAEPNPARAKVTPQVASARQLAGMIKIAADSIEKLRQSDVDRVISEAPAHFRLALASHIKSQRRDLADEVDDVMADLRAS